MKISKGAWLVILGVLLVVIDQIIKVLVKTQMDLGETIDVVGDWFKLHFVLNKGMAFGMAFGGLVGKVLLSVFRIILFGVSECSIDAGDDLEKRIFYYGSSCGSDLDYSRCNGKHLGLLFLWHDMA